MNGAGALDSDSEFDPEFDLEFDVPADETPTRCPYCDRPFRSEAYAALHLGRSHPDECTEDELETFEAERDDEEYDLFTFHVKTASTVLLTYLTFTFLYALAWT